MIVDVIGCLQTAIHAKLAIEAGQVILNCLDAQCKFVGDLFIAHAADNTR